MEPVTLPADDAATATAAIEPTDAPAPAEAKQEQAQPSQPEAPQEPSAPVEPFWYRKALSEKERANKDMARRLQQMEERLSQVAQPGPQMSPEEARQYESAALNVRISERFARKEYGALFEEARDWLSTRPDVEQWAQQQDDPWDAAINHYKREKLAAEIGDDPAAYRARIEAEIRAQFEQPGQQPGQPMTAPRIPQAAAGARSAPPRDSGSGQFTPFRNNF